jgi:ribosomal protein L40E
MTEYIVVFIVGAIVVGAIAFPLVTGIARYNEEAEFEADLQSYRDALAAGTVCDGCRAANPTDASFCTECGRALAGE